jgi:hypothetical protein
MASQPNAGRPINPRTGREASSAFPLGFGTLVLVGPAKVCHTQPDLHSYHATQDPYHGAAQSLDAKKTTTSALGCRPL